MVIWNFEDYLFKRPPCQHVISGLFQFWRAAIIIKIGRVLVKVLSLLSRCLLLLFVVGNVVVAVVRLLLLNEVKTSNI